MINDHHLNDYCAEDRLNPRLSAVDAWEREKRASRRAVLRDFGKALCYAAFVVGFLAITRVI